MAEPVDSPVVSEDGIITKDILESRWDEVIDSYGPTPVIGVDLTVPVFGDGSSPSTASLMTFLPLYLVATFLRCQKCSSCCRPNIRKWDKGIILTREEVFSLRQYCRISKRNGQHLLKYPCPLLKENNQCRQYPRRPLGCRLFPLTTVGQVAPGQVGRGIIMVCPASREFYITVELFLQELGLYLQGGQDTGNHRFNIADLEKIKQKYDYNQVSAEEMAYMKKMAMAPLAR